MPRAVRTDKRGAVAEPAQIREQPRLPNTLSFLRLLWAVDHGLRSLSKRMQARMGITAPQRLSLRILGKFPGLMPSELADLMHLDRGTMSGIVERLAAQQLISRTPHAEDGRSVTLQLTELGRRFERDSAGTVEASIRRALATFPRTKIEIASEVLEVVARELEREVAGEVQAAAERAEGE